MTYGPLCPVDPAHGRLRDWPTDRWAFYCPAAGHDGRPKSHPAGPLEPTRPFFTTTEAETGVLFDFPTRAAALSPGRRRVEAPL